MSETLTPKEQAEMRDHIFQQLIEKGREYGISEVELSQITLSSDGQKEEWVVKVTFFKREENGTNQSTENH